MKKVLKKAWFIPLLLVILTSCFALTSCGNDNNDEPNLKVSIVGKWVDGDDVLTFGKDGSYQEDGSLGQYRIGTYSYSPSTQLLVVNVKAIDGMNSAYQQTYIVQTLNTTTLVLLYTDGDIKGFYTRL